ncbi:GldG family protein [Nitrosospira sp. Is2]|uniref:GldG family protein n=1 Tax=Nitrosospira sp. Is2 TaxID=3080532 RepID=UPI00295361C6|nr:GldG family protein [Nitrosospira sp. Is2]WON74807.1 GldG family protein [Nitrosospira sp. Is2]
MSAMNSKRRWHWLVQSGLFLALVAALAGLLGYLAWENRIQWDVSHNARNSLSPASIDVLKNMNGPIAITVYATAQDAQLGNISKIIGDFLALYQRIKPDLTITFVDPDEHPQRAQAAGVQVNGETVVEFNGRQERLATFDEQALTNLLMRLARFGDKRVMGLAGHGERRLDGIASRDLGEFGKQLTSRGFTVRVNNPAIIGDLPVDTSVLIITLPQVDLSEGTVEKLLVYVERGGNLLWLVDQEPLHGLQPLAERLGLTLTAGVVVDPQAQQLRTPVTFARGASYAQHPVTNNFDYPTIFPFARQIALNESEDWHSVALVETAQSGWVETGKLDSGLAFDPMYDVSGPVPIAAAMSRTVQDHEQRIVVIGSGHFLANAYLGYGKNLDFGINVLNWLAADDDLIAIQPRATLDSNLQLAEPALTMIAWSFLIVLPLIFLTSGAMIWWNRRRK